MFDSRSLRASALGFGIAIPLCLPLADGAIGFEDCAQLVGSYREAEATTGPAFPDGIWPTRLRGAQTEYQLSGDATQLQLRSQQAEFRLRFEG